jgi:hypothetical protein
MHLDVENTVSYYDLKRCIQVEHFFVFYFRIWHFCIIPSFVLRSVVVGVYLLVTSSPPTRIWEACEDISDIQVFSQDSSCRTTYGVRSTDELRPGFPVQDHIRSVCEGVFSLRWFFVPYFRIGYFCTGILGGSFF